MTNTEFDNSVITEETRPSALVRIAGSTWARVAAFVIGWGICGLLSTLHWRVFRFYDPYTVWELLRIKLILWYLWGFFTIGIVYISRRYRLARHIWPRNFGWLLVWSIVVTIAYLTAYDILLLINLGREITWNGFERMFFFVIDYHSSFYFLAFWATVGAEHAWDYFVKFRERELRTSRLETQLAQTRLETLKSKMNPHFLFNALNAVSSLVYHKRNDEAYDLIARIAELLRHSVRDHDRQEVALEEELEFVDLYLDIVRIRFRDRLTVTVHSDPETRHAAIPSLILQPLVENAVKHGLTSSSDKVAVDIHASRKNGYLEVTVSDDGPGLPDDWRLDDSSGFGLTGARERLENMYGSEQVFEVVNGQSAGVEVRMRLPFKLVTEGV